MCDHTRSRSYRSLVCWIWFFRLLTLMAEVDELIGFLGDSRPEVSERHIIPAIPLLSIGHLEH